MNTKVGLVILNYNRGSLVLDIASDFCKYDCIDEIAIVDNCSTDNSREILVRHNNKKINILFSKENSGYAKGNNLGLKFLKEKGCNYCFVVNPDVFFKENVIRTVVDYLDCNPSYAIITCAQIDPLSKTPSCQYGTRLYDTFWLQFLNYSNLSRHYYLLRKFYVYSYDSSNKEIIDIAEALGSFLGIRMEYFPEGNVLDEGTFLYWEEQLLGFKVKQMGYKIGYVSTCRYEHRHIQYSATTNDKSLKLFKYNLQSQRYLQEKYLQFNAFQRFLIDIAEKCSLVERWIIKRIKKH